MPQETNQGKLRPLHFSLSIPFFPLLPYPFLLINLLTRAPSPVRRNETRMQKMREKYRLLPGLPLISRTHFQRPERLRRSQSRSTPSPEIPTITTAGPCVATAPRHFPPLLHTQSSIARAPHNLHRHRALLPR
ncbi:hypothetical protein MPH_12763 [Macrophomina phaseolina MS6]|uniref:Uncharacterized protein n=1 Tax=Macrophomina phaseolina (strain MS6) TaxID=1126212 RepID=K2R7B2_MACPH|nr:hypothetical protein MPH_12763 [Macrophomina phaseolina MS6]